MEGCRGVCEWIQIPKVCVERCVCVRRGIGGLVTGSVVWKRLRMVGKVRSDFLSDEVKRISVFYNTSAPLWLRNYLGVCAYLLLSVSPVCVCLFLGAFVIILVSIPARLYV